MGCRWFRIAVTAFCLMLSIDIGLVYAIDGWREYDEQWKKRNPTVRLEILNRSLKHYTKAYYYFENGDLGNAERLAHDALKVVPQFAEAHFLLAKIYDLKGKEKKAEKHRKKGEELASSHSILKERDYLIGNLDRLMENYAPSHALNRIVFYLLFIAGYFIIIFLIISSGFLSSVSMKIRRMSRLIKEDEEKKADLVVGDFPGEDNEKPLSWYWKIVIYGAPFLLCYFVSLLFGAQTKKDIIIFTLLPGLLISVLIYKIFFSDDDFSPPSKFGGMR